MTLQTPTEARPAKKPNGRSAASSVDEPKLPAELAVLYPAPKTLTIAGRAITFDPCSLKQAGRIVDAGAPLYALHVEGGVPLFDLFEDEPEKTAALIAAATGLELAWIADLSPEEKLELVTAWLEVNGAFFFLRLLPKMDRLAAALGRLVGGGRTSSIT